MINKCWYVCLMFCLLSCDFSRNILEEFEYQLLYEFIKVKQVSMLDPKFINQGNLIAGPPLGWITLVTATQFSLDHESPVTVCLAYRMPSINDKRYQTGILQMTKTQNPTCPDYYTKNDLAIHEVKHLQLIKKTDTVELLFFIGDKTVEYNLVIPINSENKKDSQILYVGYGKTDEIPVIKKRADQVILKPGEKCFDINTKCEIIKTDQCFECEFGYLEVSGGSCKEGGSKLCTPVDCGMKNKPACMRSKKVDGENWCYQDSPAGYCMDGLSTHCGSEGYLICL